MTDKTLTALEAEHAKLLFPKLTEKAALETYWRRKRELIAEGRIAPRPGGKGARDSREGR